MTRIKHALAALTMCGCLVATSLYALDVRAVTPINNRDYSPAMLTLIQNSRSNIKLMLYQARFYDEYPDTMSNKFLEEIVRALERGVCVTAILDISEWNEEGAKFNTDFARRLAEAGAQVYMDNPEIVSHQKVMLFDDTITVIGSTNWSYYSLARNDEAAGIIWSAEVNEAYTEYFNKRLAESKRFFAEPPVANLERAKSLGFDLLPAEGVVPINNRDYFTEVHKAITGSTERVWLAQMEALYYMVRPSYAPSGVEGISDTLPALTNQLLKDLIGAHERGVEVVAVLDAPTDRVNINIDFANRLLAHGIKVFFDDPEVTLHAKMLVIDNDTTIIGSTNWSLNALEQGNEASVLIDSEKVNKAYAEYIRDIIDRGTTVTKSAVFQIPEETNGTVHR